MMIENNVFGAITLSIIDMILLCVFLTVIGWVIRLLPIVNRFGKDEQEGGSKNDHN